MILFDEHIFQMGWFNHQLVKVHMNPLLAPGSIGLLYVELPIHSLNNKMKHK